MRLVTAQNIHQIGWARSAMKVSKGGWSGQGTDARQIQEVALSPFTDLVRTWIVSNLMRASVVWLVCETSEQKRLTMDQWKIHSVHPALNKCQPRYWLYSWTCIDKFVLYWLHCPHTCVHAACVNTSLKSLTSFVTPWTRGKCLDQCYTCMSHQCGFSLKWIKTRL